MKHEKNNSIQYYWKTLYNTQKSFFQTPKPSLIARLSVVRKDNFYEDTDGTWHGSQMELVLTTRFFGWKARRLCVPIPVFIGNELIFRGGDFNCDKDCFKGGNR